MCRIIYIKKSAFLMVESVKEHAFHLFQERKIDHNTGNIMYVNLNINAYL